MFEESGEPDKSLDVLADYFDDLRYDKCWSEIDLILSKVDIDRCGPIVLTGLLSYTKNAKHRLLTRRDFADKAILKLRQKKECSKNFLTQLQ